MDRRFYGGSVVSLFFLISSNASTLHKNSNPSCGSGQINSNSVLVALLDSRYTELTELVEKALLLQVLEDAVGRHNITILAPRNEALERDLDPEFKRFLLEPGNLKSLQTLLMFHIIPNRVGSDQWPSQDSGRVKHHTLGNDQVHLSQSKGDGIKMVDSAEIIRPDDLTRPDGLIHASMESNGFSSLALFKKISTVGGISNQSPPYYPKELRKLTREPTV